MAEAKKATSKIGNLTREPELKYSKSGKAYTRFGLAVSPFINGKKVEPVFYEVTCFGGLAESVAECLHKGDRTLVVGNGEVEEWTSKDGEARTTKKILADGVGPDLRFCTAVLTKVPRDAAQQQSMEADDWEPF